MSWPEVALSDAVDVLSGFAFKSSQYTDDPSHPRLLRGVNVAPNDIDVSDETYWERKPGDKLDKYELEPGDIAIAMDRPWIKSGFRIAVLKKSHLPALLVQRVSRLRAKAGFDQRYIFHQLSEGAFLRHLQVKQTETTVPHVSPKDICTFRIKVPPLAEQKRIAAILDKADEIRRKRARAIQLTEDLLRSAFLEMFGDPVTNPKGWEVKKLGDVVDIATGGTPSRKVSGNYGGNIPWVTTTEVRGGTISETVQTLTGEGLKASNCKVFPKGTVVLAMYGQGATRGRCATLGIDASTNQACAALLPAAQLSSRFLHTMLRLRYEELRSLGRGGNQPNLNLSLVRGVRVPVPDGKTQERFARFSCALERAHGHEKGTLTSTESLTSALTQRAFRGEL